MKSLVISLSLLALLAASAGCQTAPSPSSAAEEPHSEITLREGDVIKISFPGAPNLDTAPQPIRRDGRITVPVAGEVSATGLTPAQLQDEILRLVSTQLVSREVVVTVASSTFSVYVDGPVQKPGKIETDRPLTIMEAIMESGGFDYAKADIKHVQIIRHTAESRSYTYFTLNLDDVLKGRTKNLFYLAPGDMVHVPEKFSLF